MNQLVEIFIAVGIRLDDCLLSRKPGDLKLVTESDISASGPESSRQVDEITDYRLDGYIDYSAWFVLGPIIVLLLICFACSAKEILEGLRNKWRRSWLRRWLSRRFPNWIVADEDPIVMRFRNLRGIDNPLDTREDSDDDSDEPGNPQVPIPSPQENPDSNNANDKFTAEVPDYQSSCAGAAASLLNPFEVFRQVDAKSLQGNPPIEMQASPKDSAKCPQDMPQGDLQAKSQDSAKGPHDGQQANPQDRTKGPHDQQASPQKSAKGPQDDQQDSAKGPQGLSQDNLRDAKSLKDIPQDTALEDLQADSKNRANGPLQTPLPPQNDMRSVPQATADQPQDTIQDGLETDTQETADKPQGGVETDTQDTADKPYVSLNNIQGKTQLRHITTAGGKTFIVSAVDEPNIPPATDMEES